MGFQVRQGLRPASLLWTAPVGSLWASKSDRACGWRSVRTVETEGDSTGGGVTQRVTYEATLERIVERAPDTRSLFWRLSQRQRFTFTPGQFISCLLPIDEQTMIRPYSLASSPEAPELEICLNRVPGGLGSAYLFGLRAGARLRFTGPWGTFTLDRAPDAECVFIAEGTGIAPIRPMLQRALSGHTGHPIRLHHAAASRAHLLYADEFEAAARVHAHFTFAPLIGAALNQEIERRYVTEDRDRRRRFFICGVGDIVPRLRDLLRRAGYERRAVQYEKW
jgi:ferredoxin-NADP reductase